MTHHKSSGKLYGMYRTRQKEHVSFPIRHTPHRSPAFHPTPHVCSSPPFLEEGAGSLRLERRPELLARGTGDTMQEPELELSVVELLSGWPLGVLSLNYGGADDLNG